MGSIKLVCIFFKAYHNMPQPTKRPRQSQGVSAVGPPDVRPHSGWRCAGCGVFTCESDNKYFKHLAKCDRVTYEELCHVSTITTAPKSLERNQQLLWDFDAGTRQMVQLRNMQRLIQMEIKFLEEKQPPPCEEKGDTRSQCLFEESDVFTVQTRQRALQRYLVTNECIRAIFGKN